VEIVLLGTGIPFPHPDRAGPATLVRAGGLKLLFDCGRGVLMRLAGAGHTAQGIDGLFLTHLHSDHTTDFNDIVTTRWLNQPEADLPLFGPSGTSAFHRHNMAMLKQDFVWRMEYTPVFLTHEPRAEMTERDDGLVFDRDGVRVYAAPTEHPPVTPTVGYRVEHEGRSVVIGGDSVPCDGLDRLCEGANAYVQAIFKRDLVGNLEHIFRYHSSTEDAAQTAARGGVDRVVFTHMMPAPMPGTEQDWIDDAKKHFGGDTVVTKDLDVIDV
jgi:ribonuclease Z